VGGVALGNGADVLETGFLWSFILSGIGRVIGFSLGWKVGQHFK